MNSKCEKHKGLVNTVPIEFRAVDCPFCKNEVLRTAMDSCICVLVEGIEFMTSAEVLKYVGKELSKALEDTKEVK